MNMYRRIQKHVMSYYGTLIEQYSAKYVKEALLGVSLLLILGGGYLLNSWYVERREHRAFEALSEVLTSYTRALRATQGMNRVQDADKIKHAWDEALMLLDALYKEHMGSYLAPYFLAFKSQIILEKDNNVVESLQLLDEALARMQKKSDLGCMFHLKRIKMGLDSSDEKNQKESLEALVRMAQDKTLPSYEQAAYALGAYYMVQGQIAEGQKIWKQLIDSVSSTEMLQSPWVKLAQEKLGLASSIQA